MDLIGLRTATVFILRQFTGSTVLYGYRNVSAGYHEGILTGKDDFVMVQAAADRNFQRSHLKLRTLYLSMLQSIEKGAWVVLMLFCFPLAIIGLGSFMAATVNFSPRRLLSNCGDPERVIVLTLLPYVY